MFMRANHVLFINKWRCRRLWYVVQKCRIGLAILRHNDSSWCRQEGQVGSVIEAQGFVRNSNDGFVREAHVDAVAMDDGYGSPSDVPPFIMDMLTRRICA